MNRKEHWEKIYSTKQINEVSWYQPNPATSLELIQACAMPLSAKIIDIGGGDSFLVDNLLELAYQDITVLDISENAIDRAKQRLGEKAASVTWVVADAAGFKPTQQYDIWHDRAAFHFLTDKNDIEAYKSIVEGSIKQDGNLIIGTFSENGPLKCSGIEIKQYTKETIATTFADGFAAVDGFTIDHQTPFNTIQNFLFCKFKRVP